MIEGDALFCELHMNLMVESAHGIGTYCVDVGVSKPNTVPKEKPSEEWRSLENADLITFAEVKKLVIYPMLLAQFIGIVHEVKPNFLKGRKGVRRDHPSPALIVLGHYTANSADIVKSYPARNISVVIAANYDGRLARVRGGSATSPLEDSAEEL